MRVHDELYNICGIVDRKDHVRIPHTDYNLVDYKIEPPIYKMLVEINGEIIEFPHPINLGLDHLIDKINKYTGNIKSRHSRAKIVTTKPVSN